MEKMLVTSTFTPVVVKVASIRKREVIQLQDLKLDPHGVTVKETDETPLTMIHQNLSDYLLMLDIAQEWLNNQDQIRQEWEECMSLTPGLRRSLGLIEKIPAWTICLGLLPVRLLVPVKHHRTTCYDCNAPLDLYRFCQMAQDVTRWHLRWQDGNSVRSADLANRRGYCPACLVRRDWIRKIERSMGHVEERTERARELGDKRRLELFLELQEEHLRHRQELSRKAWLAILEKNRASTSGSEKE